MNLPVDVEFGDKFLFVILEGNITLIQGPLKDNGFTWHVLIGTRWFMGLKMASR